MTWLNVFFFKGPATFLICKNCIRELVALISLSSWCLVIVAWLFHVVSWVYLQFYPGIQFRLPCNQDNFYGCQIVHWDPLNAKRSCLQNNFGMGYVKMHGFHDKSIHPVVLYEYNLICIFMKIHENFKK